MNRGALRTFFRNQSGWAILVVCLWISFAWFHHSDASWGGGWNVNTRLALTFAIVEQGTFQIDRYHDSPLMPYMATNDKAWYGGHFYCDKSPALSFAAVPLYWVMYGLRETAGFWDGTIHGVWAYWSRYIVRIFTTSLAAAFLGVVFAWQARLFGAGRRLSVALALTVVCGTVLCGYSVVFYPYLPGCLAAALAYGVLMHVRLGKGGTGRGAWAWGAAAGGLTGLAWFFDPTFGLAGLGLSGYALWTFRRRAPALALFILCGLVWVAVFYGYSYSIFGEFAMPYKFEYDDFFRTRMAEGFQGIGRPNLTALYYLTIHPFKGLFLFSPFLLLWFVGFFATGRWGRYGPDLALAAFVLPAYLLFNSSYYMWWGGWAAGPRLLCPAMPFVLPPIALWVMGGRSWRRIVFGVLAVASIFFQTAIAAVDPQIPTGLDTEPIMAARISDNLPSPIWHGVLKRWVRGELGANAGQWLFGLKGLWALTPLCLLWGGGGWLMWRRLGTPRPPGQES